MLVDSHRGRHEIIHGSGGLAQKTQAFLPQLAVPAESRQNLRTPPCACTKGFLEFESYERGGQVGAEHYGVGDAHSKSLTGRYVVAPTMTSAAAMRGAGIWMRPGDNRVEV